MKSPDVGAAEELADLREEICGLLEQAESILRTLDDQGERRSAEGYWLAHLRCALGDLGYTTHSPTMFSTIEALTDNRCGGCGDEMDDEMDGEDNELCIFCRGEAAS